MTRNSEPAPRRVSRADAALHASPIQEHVHRWWWWLSRRLDRRSLSVTDFVRCLQEMGVQAGGVVMVHSSMDEITRRVPELDALRLIRLLQEIVGEEGTLLMPTFPFTGRQLHYSESQDLFDPRRTPSRVGMLTEIFRRLPGVVRSLHPTHSVAGWGKRAAELLGDHHHGSTFGPTSPFYRLLEYDGLVVGLGVGLFHGFTVLHVAEEMNPRVRELILDPRPKTMKIAHRSEIIHYELHPLRSDRERDLRRLERVLLSDGTLRYVVRGGLLFSRAWARRFVRRTAEQLERDSYLS